MLKTDKNKQMDGMRSYKELQWKQQYTMINKFIQKGQEQPSMVNENSSYKKVKNSIAWWMRAPCPSAGEQALFFFIQLNISDALT